MRVNKSYLGDGDTFIVRHHVFRVEHKPDESHGAPWDECDGHGVVTDWRFYLTDEEAKKQGLWLLNSEHGSARYYDFRASLAVAKRDGWGRGKSDSAKRRAVKRDYEYLRRWCNDQWRYVGCVVSLVNGPDAGESESLWGIESDASKYLEETARELADEILSRVESKVTQGKLNAAAPQMFAKLRELLSYESEAFNDDSEIDDGDMVEWFIEFRNDVHTLVRTIEGQTESSKSLGVQS